jgi:hypothetical protein
MSYVPGSPVVFQVERISQDKGLFGPYSIIRAGERIFFYSTQGFHRIDPGGFPTPIGRERIDRTFFADLDRSNLQLFIGAADPRNSRVFWAYKSANGTANQSTRSWPMTGCWTVLRRSKSAANICCNCRNPASRWRDWTRWRPGR